MNNGWVKMHRQLMDKGYYRNSFYVHLWLHLIYKANHEGKEFMWNGKITKVFRGQIITSRGKLSAETGIEESKIERILKCFENEQQIEQRSFSKFRLISLKKYQDYQKSEQENEQQVNSKRTASEQQVNTNKNVRIKECKKGRVGVRFAPPTLEEVTTYCTERKNKINPQSFLDFYEARGWMIGKYRMKDWKAAIRTWEARDKEPGARGGRTGNPGVVKLHDGSEAKFWGGRWVDVNNPMVAYDLAHYPELTKY